MAKKSPDPRTTLELQRTFAAPREKVFQAWTEPQALKKWFAPSDQYSTTIAEVDLRVGGRYRIGMKHSDKDVPHIVNGTYREIRPPERLVFTWSWEGEESKETLVTIEFRDRGNSTEVILTHEFFISEEVRREHEIGWNGCLDRLVRAL